MLDDAEANSPPGAGDPPPARVFSPQRPGASAGRGSGGAGRSFQTLLLAALVVSALLKVGLAILTRGLPPTHDELSYLSLGALVAEGRGVQPFRGYLWPPGHPAVLAVFLSLPGESRLRGELVGLYGDLNRRPPVMARVPGVFALARVSRGLLLLRIVQALASTLSAWLLFTIGRRLFGSREGVIAAVIFAFLPEMVAFSHYLWNETLYLTILLGAGAALFAALEGATRTKKEEAGISVRGAALAGVLFGLAALFKGVALFLAVLAAIAVGARAVARARRTRGRTSVRALAPAVALLGGVAVCVLPWTIAASRAQGRFVLLEATVGKNLRLGNNPSGPSNWDWGSPPPWDPSLSECAQDNVVDRDRCAGRLAMRYVADHPLLSLLRIGSKMCDLWSPSSFLIRQVRAGAYGAPSRALVQGITLLSAIPYFAIMLLGAAGIAMAPSGWGRRWLLGYLLAGLVIHAATFGMSRFRIPLMPVPILFAGVAIARGPGRALFAECGWRRLAVAAGLALFLVIAWGMRASRVFDVFLR